MLLLLLVLGRNSCCCLALDRWRLIFACKAFGLLLKYFFVKIWLLKKGLPSSCCCLLETVGVKGVAAGLRRLDVVLVVAAAALAPVALESIVFVVVVLVVVVVALAMAGMGCRR